VPSEARSPSEAETAHFLTQPLTDPSTRGRARARNELTFACALCSVAICV
jgi:hypothetical protein